MSAQDEQTRADAASAYLQHLGALATELRSAMSAISSNSLSELEESVSRQEMICSELVVLSKSMGDDLQVSPQPLQAAPDNSIGQKINAAGNTIRSLNLEYASLLKHSGRTIALLLSLYRSQKGHFPETRGAMLKYQTWSCQM